MTLVYRTFGANPIFRRRKDRDQVQSGALGTMQKLLLKWLCLTVAVVASAYATSALGQPFSARTDSPSSVLQLFIGAAALALINATLGKLLKFITAPMNCMTLGLMSLVVNALLLWWVGSMGFGFQVGNFLAAFIGSVLISIFNGLLGGILIRDKEKDEE